MQIELTGIYTVQKKKGIILVMLIFSVLDESGYMEYAILLTEIFHIGLCNKFRDKSSVKGLSRSPCWAHVKHKNKHMR